MRRTIAKCLMSSRLVLTALVALSLGAPVIAQDVNTGERTLISPEDWRAMAAGRTLTYTVNGDFFALERYDASGNAVSIQLSDGLCMAGHWTHVDDAYCYMWEGRAPVCFLHERIGDRISVRQVINGVETGAEQTMSQISDAPLQCGALTS